MLHVRRSEKLQEAGVDVIELDGGSRSLLRNAWRYKHLTRSFSAPPDVIHAHAPVAATIALIANVGPTHLTLHASEFSFPKPVLRILARRVASVSTGSSALAGTFSEAFGIPVLAFPYGLTVPQLNQRARQPAGPGFRLLFAGRLEPQKNPERLLRSLAAVRVRDPARFAAIQVRIVGDGSQRKSIASLVSTLHLDKDVTLVGATSELDGEFNWCDCLVMSSDFEGVPLTLLEAAARRIPIISTPFPAALEIASLGGNIALSSDFSDEALAAILLETMTQYLDSGPPSLKGGRVARVASVDEMRCELDKIYAQVPPSRSCHRG